MFTTEKAALDFTLPDQNGNDHTLSSYRGRWVLIYFYPKDDTPGCTKEACGLRDAFKDLQKQRIVILGISKDSVASHKKFSDKYSLPFPILADPEKKVLHLYDVWGEKKFMGKTYMGTKRMSFLVNPSGKITKIYTKVNPLVHAKEVLDDVGTFSG